MSQASGHQENRVLGTHESHDHHVVPLGVFIKVFAALITLTVLTVVTAKLIDFGAFNGLIAFTIATIKGGLVMAYFMHLKYDDKMFRIIIGSSFLFVFLLFIICVTDIATRVAQHSAL